MPQLERDGDARDLLKEIEALKEEAKSNKKSKSKKRKKKPKPYKKSGATIPKAAEEKSGYKE